MNKPCKTLYLMAGIPASGKSTYARELAAATNAIYISRDEIRFSLLGDAEDYFAHETQVYNLFVMKVQDALDRGYSCIADATHLNAASRNKLLNRLELGNTRVELIILDTPLAVCFERNEKRTGRAHVPSSAIRRMFMSFSSPTGEEAEKYDKITRIKEDHYDE